MPAINALAALVAALVGAGPGPAAAPDGPRVTITRLAQQDVAGVTDRDAEGDAAGDDDAGTGVDENAPSQNETGPRASDPHSDDDAAPGCPLRDRPLELIV